MRRGIFCLVGAVLAAGGIAARGADMEQAGKGNVTIQVPKGWAVVAGNGRSVLAAHPGQVDKDVTGEFQADFSITQDGGTKVDAGAQQTVLSRQMPQYKVVEKPTPVATGGGLQGVMFGGAFQRAGAELRTRQYMFLVDKQIYTLTFTCLNSQWGNYQASLEASVATFVVKH